MTEATNNYQRQRQLLASGFTTRVRYDEATQTLQTARSQADSARAQLGIAIDVHHQRQPVGLLVYRWLFQDKLQRVHAQECDQPIRPPHQ